jgi:aminoglycoside 3-N-acetyltransferase
MNWFERLSGWAVKCLSPDQLAVVRNAYLGVRQHSAPLVRAIRGTFDAEELRRHLEAEIGRDFEILMVHCSVNHMSPAYTQGPLELLRMLTAYCAEDRTLAMPAFYFGDPEQGGVGQEFKQKPRFDLRRTPSQMGLLSEMFRRSKGVLSSRHPVMRVAARGPLAAEITTGHERAPLPCGTGSPFDHMARRNTLILGIGKPFEVLTQVHHAEDLLGDEFPVPAAPAGEPLAMELVDGTEVVPFQLCSRGLAWRRDMGLLRDLMPAGRLRSWSFHGVPLFAVRAAHVTDALINAARQGRTIYLPA